MTVNEWISSKVRAAAVERKLEAGKALFRTGAKTVGLLKFSTVQSVLYVRIVAGERQSCRGLALYAARTHKHEGLDLEIGYCRFSRNSSPFLVHALQIVDRFVAVVSTVSKLSDGT